MPDLQITYPDDLPVSQRREEILEAIRDHQVVVIAGATGSGKTTQLPKMCLELGRKSIAHTQPRRIAARAVAERISEELKVELGGLVGYQVRFTDKVSAETKVKVMTDGILLNAMQRHRNLEQYDTIIIDEAHERSLNIDFLLGYLKQLLPKRPDLKVIVTSATIDPESFSKHFNDAPIIEVSGRTFPIEVRYRPTAREAHDDTDPDEETTASDYIDGIIKALKELEGEAEGDTLVFLSGESEIRRYLLEQDLVEAIIALPTDMFYNTGIATYIWILDNAKAPERKGKVQLVDATQMFEKMRKNLGSKRKEISPQNLRDIVRTYAAFEETETSKIFKNTDFGYRQITVERPLMLAFKIDQQLIEDAFLAKPVLKMSEDERTKLSSALNQMHNEFTSRAEFLTALTEAAKKQGLSLAAPALKALVAIFGTRSDDAELCLDSKGKIEPDSDARDTENVPLSEDVEAYFEREVKQFAPDAWLDPTKEKIGYEIPFTRHFYKYEAPRSLEEIDADLNKLIAEISQLLIEIEN